MPQLRQPNGTSRSEKSNPRDRFAEANQAGHSRATSSPRGKRPRDISTEPPSTNGFSNEDSTYGQDGTQQQKRKQTPKESSNGTVSANTALVTSAAEDIVSKQPATGLDVLRSPGHGTRERLDTSKEAEAKRLAKLSAAYKTILECVGEDPNRHGLLGTPERAAKAMMFFTKGYEEDLEDVVNGAVFKEEHDEMVIVKDIEIYSLCEHHLVPFVGKINIGYIPNPKTGKVLGISKLARIAETYARRLQLQERLTTDVAKAVNDILDPRGVGVVMEASHLCMEMRGVQKSGRTITSSMQGCMRTSAKTREEFMTLIRR